MGKDLPSIADLGLAEVEVLASRSIDLAHHWHIDAVGGRSHHQSPLDGSDQPSPQDWNRSAQITGTSAQWPSDPFPTRLLGAVGQGSGARWPRALLDGSTGPRPRNLAVRIGRYLNGYRPLSLTIKFVSKLAKRSALRTGIDFVRTVTIDPPAFGGAASKTAVARNRDCRG